MCGRLQYKLNRLHIQALAFRTRASPRDDQGRARQWVDGAAWRVRHQSSVTQIGWSQVLPGYRYILIFRLCITLAACLVLVLEAASR